MKTIGAVILLLAVAVIADADCRQRVVYQTPYVAPVVAVTPIIQAVYVPFAVPTYSVTYIDPAASLRAEFQQFKAEIFQQLRQPQQQQQQFQTPMPQASEPKPEAKADQSGDGLAIFTQNCASCHEKAVATAKGKGHAFFEGNQVSLNFKQTTRILTKLAKNEMPPGKEKLSQEQYAKVVEWLDSLK